MAESRGEIGFPKILIERAIYLVHHEDLFSGKHHSSKATA